MLFRSKPIEIPNNKSMAQTYHKYLLRELQKGSTLKTGYINAVEGYVSSGYARKVSEHEMNDDQSHRVWYISHNAVINPKKPGNVSVVDYYATKYADKRLNDNFYTGPDILNSLLGVFFLFLARKGRNRGRR